MSASAAIVTRQWRVGGFTCTLSVPRPDPKKPMAACIEWEPYPPAGALSPAELSQYRSGRNAALADLAKELDIRIGVVEL